MTREAFNRRVRRTALLTIALVAALVFGVLVLAGGDWLPGGIIVASSVIGLVSQIPIIRKLRTEAPARPPRRGKPVS